MIGYLFQRPAMPLVSISGNSQVLAKIAKTKMAKMLAKMLPNRQR